jgi:hypothetical protein
MLITFPTGTDAGTDTGTGVTTATTPTAAAPITPILSPGFSFLTQTTSLVVTSVPTTAAGTLTDPDQPTTTLTLAGTAQVPPSQAPLPTGLPSRIYPANQMTPSTSLDGYSFISILFNVQLNWPFVATNQTSSSQIFAYFPSVLEAALNLTGESLASFVRTYLDRLFLYIADQVVTFALQVYVPASYTGPSDIDQLETMWLGYIPSDEVDNLAAQIKAENSEFYTGTTGVSQQLATHVNSGFPLTSVPDPNKGGNSGLPASNSGLSNEAKVRQNAIIGVVTTLGSIAIIILFFLLYRSYKQRRSLAHQRLSDPAPGPVVGQRPAGQEFDQDSVGGQRRRSFYYAEDSLRGFQVERQEEPETYTTRLSPTGMRARIAPTAISAPILRENSMNW